MPRSNDSLRYVFRHYTANNLSISTWRVVRIVDIKSFDRFAENLRKIKKAENIKNNAVAFGRMLNIVEDYLSKS
jgi:ASC-1-like (ASCH) protein